MIFLVRAAINHQTRKMIREYITYLLSDSIAGARRAGLVKESVAIEARYKRQSTAWQPHLESCKLHVSEALKWADPQKPVLVLGAGPCLDLPLQHLSNHPAGTVLMDAVRLPGITKLLKTYQGLSFELYDVTGLLSGREDESAYLHKAPIDVKGYGLIISMNILSQLPLAFTNVPAQSPEEEFVMQSIQLAHVRALEESSAPCLVISDYKAIMTLPFDEIEYNTLDSIIFATDPQASWLWNTAPKGELGKDKELCLEVGIWRLNWELINDGNSSYSCSAG